MAGNRGVRIRLPRRGSVVVRGFAIRRCERIHRAFSWLVLTGDRGFESISLQRGVWCEPDFRGRIPSMTVGDFANADPAPAPLYAREVKATMAEAGLPAEAERRFPVRIRIGIPRDGLGSRLDRIRVWSTRIAERTVGR